MKKILIGFVLFLLAASAWGYIPPANLTVSGQGLSITGGTQAVNGTGTNITISKVASADYSTSSGSAGTASTAGYASTAGAASTALTAGVAAYAVLTGTASSTAHATTADYASLTAISSSCSGNANTVTNGVYTSNTYSNPTWLSSVSYSTLTGTASTCSGYASNITGTLAVTNGGTNITSYATGDVLYASSSTALSRKAIGAAGQALISRNGIPTWEALAGSGTVTQIATGTGLTGGPITTTGTLGVSLEYYTATKAEGTSSGSDQGWISLQVGSTGYYLVMADLSCRTTNTNADCILYLKTGAVYASATKFGQGQFHSSVNNMMGTISIQRILQCSASDTLWLGVLAPATGYIFGSGDNMTQLTAIRIK